MRDDDPHRGLWIGSGVGLTVLILIGGFAIWALNPERLRPRLIEMAQQATGRTLTINGKIGMEFSLHPTISVEDVALSNPPGSSRQDMIRIARVELSFALEPLLHRQLEVDRISLQRPDFQLEAEPSGRLNWILARRAASTGGTGAPSGPSGDRFAVSVRDVSVTDGHVAWFDSTNGRTLEAEIPRLAFTASADGLIQASGTAIYGGDTIELSGGTTTPRYSVETGEAEVWPVELKLTSAGASLSVDGEIAHPLEGRGYKLSLDGTIPAPADFAAWFPRWPLKALSGIAAKADLRDDGGRQPLLSSVEMTIRAVDLSAIVEKGRLEDVTLTGHADSPLKVSAHVMMPGADWGFGGNVGDLAWLNAGASGPVPVDVELNAASARATVKGEIQVPRRLSGVDLDVAVNVPDPSLVNSDAPPALRAVTFQTKLTDTPGPIPFQFASNAGDLAGALTIVRTPRLSVEGHVSSHRLDLDMLGTRPTSVVRTAAKATAEPVARDKNAPVFSDRSLKLERIRDADADVTFRLDQVHLGGTDIGSVDGALVLKSGVLRLDPFRIANGEQHQTAVLEVDAAHTPPAMRLAVDAPGLRLRPLLDLLDLPAVASGTADLRASLTATGDTPRALAASVSGWAGLAVEGGQLDAGLVNSWLDELKPLHINGADRTDLRCFAVRADANAGNVTIAPSALNTAAVIVEGSGDVNLGDETLALRLRPRAKIGGTGVALPVVIGGRLRAPSAKIDISPSGGGGGALAGLILGGKEVMGADPCPDALARAREVGADDDAEHRLTLPATGGAK